MACVLSTRLLLVALASSVTLAAAPARAEGPTPPAPTTPDASGLPPGPAKRQILEVQKKAREEKLSPAVLAKPVGEAIRAAERARGARDAGDATHGALLDKLAEQWAGAALAVLGAVQAERRAKTEASRLAELTTKVKRAEALLHERQARLGRLRAELKLLEQKAEEAKVPATTGTKSPPPGTKAPAPPPKKKAQP